MKSNSTIIKTLKLRIAEIREDLQFLSILQKDLKSRAEMYEKILKHWEKERPFLLEMPNRRVTSIADHIESILAEFGTMSVQAIMYELHQRGVNSDRQTVSGVITRNVRAGKRFRRISTGVYDVLEVDEGPNQ